jgi:hypothetical protein
MTQKYIVPFNIDMDDLIEEDKGKTEEQLLQEFQWEGIQVGVEVNIKDKTVTGKIRALADFFMMLDGPGPSFNMEEFVEFVHVHGDIAPEKPIDILAKAQGDINQLECLCEDLIFKTLDSIYGGREQWKNDPQVFNEIEEMLVNIGETFSQMDADRPKTPSDFPINVALRYG